MIQHFDILYRLMFHLEWRYKLFSHLPEVKDVGLWSPLSAPFEQWEWPFNGLLFWHFWVFIEWNVSSGLGEWLEEFPESTSTIPLEEWPPQDVRASRSSSSSMSKSCVSIKRIKAYLSFCSHMIKPDKNKKPNHLLFLIELTFIEGVHA